MTTFPRRAICFARPARSDLLVTNVTRIQTAIERGACNALLLKVNQIGSVTESINAALLAKSAGWGVMVRFGAAVVVAVCCGPCVCVCVCA